MKNPFLVGDRLYLRPLEPARDSLLYASWLNNEEVRRYFSVYPTSDARAQERLELHYQSREHIILGIALKSDNRLVGLVGLKDIDYLNQSGEFYILIGEPSLWGQGYGTEATRLMVGYGFRELNLNRIQSKDFQENVGAWRADEKAGFTYEGNLREAMLRFGQFQDIRLYSILRREYLAGP